MKAEKINVRGVMFDNVTLDSADALLRSRMSEGLATAVFTPNSEIVQSCIEDADNMRIINSAELVIPDGVGVVKASSILGTPLKGKVAGVDLGERILKMAADCGYKVFFFGGKPVSEGIPSIADQAAEKMCAKYPGLHICGTRDGYCGKSGNDNDETLRIIGESGAEILFVFFGAPAQEKWIFENRNLLPNVRLLAGLGGSIDCYSGNVRRAPDFFINHNLEWFYRLLCSPSRIGRMMKLPKFYFGTWIYKIRHK